MQNAWKNILQIYWKEPLMGWVLSGLWHRKWSGFAKTSLCSSFVCLFSSLCPTGACSRTEWTVLCTPTRTRGRDWGLVSSYPWWREWNPWADHIYELTWILQCCCSSCASCCQEANAWLSVPGFSCTSYGTCTLTGKVKLFYHCYLRC